MHLDMPIRIKFTHKKLHQQLMKEPTQIAKRLRARSGPVMANYPGRVWLPDMDRSWAEPRPRINPALACQIQTKFNYAIFKKYLNL